MEKFDLLVKILGDLQEVGILKHLVLVGSWCQDFYRYQFGNPPQIPATFYLRCQSVIRAVQI